MPEINVTPEQIGLSQEEFNALLQVRDMLAQYVAEPQVDLLFLDNGDRAYYARKPADYLPSGCSVNKLDGFGGFKMDTACNAYTPDQENDTNSYYECGTVACIGGWLSLFMQGVQNKPGTITRITRVQEVKAAMFVEQFSNDCDRAYDRNGNPSVMYMLFYPAHDNGQRMLYWDKITTADAVEAIDNVLRDGQPHWQTIERDYDGHRDAVKAALVMS